MIYFIMATLALALAGGLLRTLPAPVTAKRARLLRMVAVAVALAALVPLVHRDASTINLGWIPWIEPGVIALDESGTELSGLAILGYALLLWQDADQPALAWWQALAAPLLLAASFAALNVNHFLYRYVFLEAAALATLVMTVRRGNWHDLVGSFLTLRLGDLALLGAIIVLWQAHDTLLISPMLAAAAQAADGTTWLAVLMGLLAVWIKLGLYPFDRWLAVAGEIASPERWSAATAGLPLLGAYLLYRLEGGIQALYLTTPLVVAGAGITIWALICAGRAESRLRLHHLEVAHGALALVIVPLGWPYAYLYSFMPLRGVLMILSAPRVVDEARGEYADNAPLNTRWDRLSIAALFVETRLLEPLNAWVWHLTESASRAASAIDEHVLEKGFVNVQRSALGVGRRLRRLHTGKLRANLAWMAGLIVLALAFVAVFSLL